MTVDTNRLCEHRIGHSESCHYIEETAENFCSHKQTAEYCPAESVSENAAISSVLWREADSTVHKEMASMPLGVSRNLENILYLDERGSPKTAGSAAQVTENDTG